MKSSQLFFILISLNLILIGENLQQKCCKIGHQIVEKNSKFLCEKVQNVRLQDNFKIRDFLAENKTGICSEISEKSVAIFSVNNVTKNVEKREDFPQLFFPKCCPLNYQYNKITHGCEENPGKTISILKINSFVRVGLPECEIISDKILESTQDVKMNGKDLVLLKEKRILEENYCIDSTLDEKLVVRICEKDFQICSRLRCIRKCCPDGKSFFDQSVCVDTFKFGVNLEKTERIHYPESPFILVHGFTKPIKRLSAQKYKFNVDRFGIFSVYNNGTDLFESHEVSDSIYCIEHVVDIKKSRVNNYTIFIKKSKTPPIPTNILITRWLKIVSCIFLVLTISVYLYLPKMRNLFGKILLSYCVSTLAFFTLLVLSQFYSSSFSNATCISIGYLSIISTIWSFTWLQIMCIDIWFSFGTPRTLSGPLQKNEWRLYLQYSLYGWGFSILWILMITVFSVFTMMPDAIRPVIGSKRCILENSSAKPGNYSYLVYITFPLLVQQIVNTVLFVKTILYCLKIKAEIERLNDTDRRTSLEAGKERFELVMKLAVIMGVFFIFETVSSVHNFQENAFTAFIENVWDSINCLQGLFIFIIFICKRKIYENLCERIPFMRQEKSSVVETETQFTTQNYNNDMNK